MSRGDGLTMRVDGAMDFDGRVDGQFTLWLDGGGGPGGAGGEGATEGAAGLGGHIPTGTDPGHASPPPLPPTVDISDLSLELDLAAAAVPFAAGIGLEGGWRPCNGHEWRWEPSHPRTEQGYAPGMGEGATWDNMAWLGSPAAGVKLNLQPDPEVSQRHNPLGWKLMRKSWPDSW